MNDRPTPEQIARWLWTDAAPRLLFLEELAEHGYVIVHPDDIPIDTEQGSGMLAANPYDEYANAYDEGWNECRDFIFTTAEQEVPS